MNKIKAFSVGSITLLSVLIVFFVASELSDPSKLTELKTVSMVIEDRDYIRGGLLPPDDFLLEYEYPESFDIEDSLGKSSKYYKDVENLFEGYDEILIFETAYNDEYPETTYIYLSKDPVEYETYTGEFYYDMINSS